jgi:fatty acid desaturase
MIPRRPFIFLGVIAGIEGIGLLAYAVYDAAEGIRIGATGPAEVSSVPALILQIAILGAFGAGLVLVGTGWMRERRWARAPFLLAQLIALVIGGPLVSAVGGVERIAGIIIILLAATGVVLVFTPAVTRSLAEHSE